MVIAYELLPYYEIDKLLFKITGKSQIKLVINKWYGNISNKLSEHIYLSYCVQSWKIIYFEYSANFIIPLII